MQSPAFTYLPTQISKSAANSEYGSATEQYTCPDSEIAKIRVYIRAVGERHHSDVPSTIPTKVGTDQHSSDITEAVNQGTPIKKEKPSLRRKGKLSLTLLPY